MSGRARRARGPRRSYAQHFLASDALARDIVERARITAIDRVVEIGAGRGVLTEAIAAHAAHVLAIEIDPSLVNRLADRFASTPSVTVLHGDALELAWPATPFRVLANVPFNRTTDVLRRLFDHPCSGLVRADLVVQWQVARERARVSDGPPIDLLGVTWGPWWTFSRGRRLPASLFRPSPSVDAAMLVAERRPCELLPRDAFERYARFVRSQFEHDPSARDRTLDEWAERFVSGRRVP